MIISAYQGTGKTTLAKKDLKYIDLESSNFQIDGKKFDNWEYVYCNIARSLSKDGYIVFISAHPKVKDILHTFEDCNVLSVFPSFNLEHEWIEKLKNRYNEDPTDKNYRAYDYAFNNYADNIYNLKIDKRFEQIELTDMGYNLERIINDWCVMHVKNSF